MARGFHTTLGAATTDIITTSLSTNAVLRSVWVWNYVRANTVSAPAFWRQETGSIINQLVTNISRLQFYRTWSGGNAVWYVTQPSLGAWHSLGWSYNGGSTANDPIAYVDGTKPSVTRQVAPSGTLSSVAGGTMKLGNDPSKVSCLDGLLAEFAVWDVILTDDEFFAMNKGCSPLTVRPQSLVEYVPLVRDNVSAKLAAPSITGTAVQPHPRIIMPRPLQPPSLHATPSFRAAWSMGTNLPVLGTGNF